MLISCLDHSLLFIVLLVTSSFSVLAVVELSPPVSWPLIWALFPASGWSQHGQEMAALRAYCSLEVLFQESPRSKGAKRGRALLKAPSSHSALGCPLGSLSLIKFFWTQFGNYWLWGSCTLFQKNRLQKCLEGFGEKWHFRCCLWQNISSPSEWKFSS